MGVVRHVIEHFRFTLLGVEEGGFPGKKGMKGQLLWVLILT